MSFSLTRTEYSGRSRSQTILPAAGEKIKFDKEFSGTIEPLEEILQTGPSVG